MTMTTTARQYGDSDKPLSLATYAHCELKNAKFFTGTAPNATHVPSGPHPSSPKSNAKTERGDAFRLIYCTLKAKIAPPRGDKIIAVECRCWVIT